MLSCFVPEALGALLSPVFPVLASGSSCAGSPKRTSLPGSINQPPNNYFPLFSFELFQLRTFHCVLQALQWLPHEYPSPQPAVFIILCVTVVRHLTKAMYGKGRVMGVGVGLRKATPSRREGTRRSSRPQTTVHLQSEDRKRQIHWCPTHFLLFPFSFNAEL